MRRKAAKTAFKRSRGMTLVEVVVALGVMVLIFSMFTMFIDIAANMNVRAASSDIALSGAEQQIYSTASSGSGTVTFSAGGDTYDHSVELFSVSASDGGVDVELRRFAP